LSNGESMPRLMGFWMLVLATSLAGAAAAGDQPPHSGGVAILPATFTLHGTESLQQVILVETAQRAEEDSADVRPGPLITGEGVTWEAVDPGIAKFDDGRVLPISDGTTTIVARTSEGRTAHAEVTVSGM